MSLNGYVFGNSTIAGSTSAIFNPTTANTYQIKCDQDGKVGIAVIWLSGSSSGFLRMQVGLGKSTDKLAWQGGAGLSTDVATFYSPMTTVGLTAASSTEYVLLGPFETAKYASISTAGYKVINFTVDAQGSGDKVSGSTLSTTLSVMVSTIKCMAFVMP
jgi:hypothetical protein